MPGWLRQNPLCPDGPLHVSGSFDDLFYPRLNQTFSRIVAGNLIVKDLARVIVGSTTFQMVGKPAKYRFQARSVQVDSFCLAVEVEWFLRDLQYSDFCKEAESDGYYGFTYLGGENWVY
jgi:hypothetical protein